MTVSSGDLRVKIYKFVPDEDSKRDFAEIEKGSLIDIDGQLHILVDVDPWCGYVVRYTWLMEMRDRFGYWTGDKFKREFRGYVERRHLVNKEQSAD
jgi:hypothetical protein